MYNYHSSSLYTRMPLTTLLQGGLARLIHYHYLLPSAADPGICVETHTRTQTHIMDVRIVR